MARRDKDLEERLVAIAATAGVRRLQVRRGGSHPILEGERLGERIRFSFPGSTSDWRSPANTVSDFRHYLELRWPELTHVLRPHSTKARVRRGRKPNNHLRQRIADLCELEPLSESADKWFGPLAELASRLAESVTGESGRQPNFASHSPAQQLRAPQFGRNVARVWGQPL
jgi:hypothetical protein